MAGRPVRARTSAALRRGAPIGPAAYRLRRTLALAALLAAGTLPISAAPLSAQPLTQRTPNLAGTWTSSPRVLHFQFSHRFRIVGGDADITDLFGDGELVNYPTFDLSLGLFRGALAGVRYSSNSAGARLSNEWQPYLKFAPLRGVGDGRLSVSLLGAWNGANQSLDGELAAETRAGPLLFSAAVRGFSDLFDLPAGVDDEALAVAGGLGIEINRYVSLSGDVADLVAGPEGDLAWSAGLNVGIPFTPHTLSLLVTNVTSGTLQGASAGSGTFLPGGNEVFWGFEFTVPFSGFARWGRIFDPDEPGREPAEGGPEAGRRVVEVEISGLSFGEAELRIPAGTTVRWVNRDPVAHTATSEEGVWESPLIGPGETFEQDFDRPGEYRYYCVPHPFMRAAIIVEG